MNEFLFSYRSGGSQLPRRFAIGRDFITCGATIIIEVPDGDFPISVHEWEQVVVTSDSTGYTREYLNGTLYSEGDLGEIPADILGSFLLKVDS